MRSQGGLGAIVLSSLLVACSVPGGTDKAGTDTLVLELATIDGQLDGSSQAYASQTFVDTLRDVSNGRIRVELTTSYGGEQASAESDLVRAIAEGDVDAGWPASRAFAEAGIAGLAALEAPLAVTSYDAQRALVEGPASQLVADALRGSGIHGLGLAVGPLRRPFGVSRFFLKPEDWQGARFRSFNSPTQSATIESWGGKAVQAGDDWHSMVRGDELDGVEFDVAQYLDNEFGSPAGRVTSNLVLWPKMLVLGINEDLWDRMTDDQRDWVISAADQAVQASIAGPYDDSDVARELCSRGARFEAAGPAALVALRDSAAPVVDALAVDPVEAPLLRQVHAVARRYGSPDVIDTPATCGADDRRFESTEIPSTLAPIPNGTYRTQITESDVAAAGLTNNDGTSGTWTLEVEDGRWYLSCSPIASPGLDCGQTVSTDPLDAGRFYGDNRTVWLVRDAALLAESSGCQLPADGQPGHCEIPLDPTMLEWSLTGDELSFSSPQLFRQFELIVRPYVRIG